MMFAIEARANGELALCGRLDAARADHADRELQKVTTSVRLDLSALDYISSAGIAVLVKLQLRLRESNHAVVLVALQPRVRAVFHFAKIEEFFGIL